MSRLRQCCRAAGTNTLLSPSINPQAKQPAPESDEAVSETDAQFAVTLARGLSLLQCFTPERPILSNGQLASLTGLGKSTISRFAYTLCELGYLTCDRTTGRYQLGPAVLSLAYPLLATTHLRQAARGPMQRLADDVGGSVSIGVRDRLTIVYIETSRTSSGSPAELSDIGMSHPIGRSAIGRAYLAGCDPAARDALMNQIKVKAPEQLADLPRLQQNLREFHQRGFCCSFGDVRQHVHAVGVPLRSRVTGTIFAFNCVIPAFALKRGQLVAEIGPRLVAMVRSLEMF